MTATIRTVSGETFDLLRPEASVISIQVIAHALSRICRYTGHTKDHYSVAQHSVLVSQMVDHQYALQGLLHDAAEAYIGDVAKPLKMLLPDYQRVEERVERAVLHHFGLPEQLHPSVKEADQAILQIEQRELMSDDSSVANLAIRWIEPWDASFAREAFLRRFKELTTTRAWQRVDLQAV